MITNLIIGLVDIVVTAFNALMPHLTLPTWLTTNAFSSTIADDVGGLLAPISAWFPVDAVLNCVYAALVLLPIFAAYSVFQWVWRHVPTIAGFGTGNG
jgi:hypothetical protein